MGTSSWWLADDLKRPVLADTRCRVFFGLAQILYSIGQYTEAEKWAVKAKELANDQQQLIHPAIRCTIFLFFGELLLFRIT